MHTLPSSLSQAQQSIVTFMTGINSAGQLQLPSGWNFDSRTGGFDLPDTAHSFGVGGTCGYLFDMESYWSPQEIDSYVQSFALWSAIANVNFKIVATADEANVAIIRGDTGPNSDRHGASLDCQPDGTGYAPGNAGDTAIPAILKSTLIISTPTTSFGDITSFSIKGGYGRSTVVHEIGHLVGLMHSGPYNGDVDSAVDQYNTYDNLQWSIMSYIRAEDQNAAYYGQHEYANTNWATNGVRHEPQTPMLIDIIGAQQIYGAPTNETLSGGQHFGFNSNVTYTKVDGTTGRIAAYDFTVNVDPVITIWDYGTNNTLDFSGFDSTSRVNLNPGTFSSVDGMTNNICIAYNTRIDTFIGGSADDEIWLNDDSDIIDGRAGFNTVHINDVSSSYTIRHTGDRTDTVSNGIITDTLTNIQLIAFNDRTVDLSNPASHVSIVAINTDSAESYGFYA